MSGLSSVEYYGPRSYVCHRHQKKVLRYKGKCDFLRVKVNRKARTMFFLQRPLPLIKVRGKKVKVKSLSRVQLFATPLTVAYQAPRPMGFFQAWILEWVAISFSRGFSRPRNWTQVFQIVDRRFTIWATREAQSERRFVQTECTASWLFKTKRTLVEGVSLSSGRAK